MGDRALAHIEKIVKTYPIEGADNIEMVQVLDFHVVAKKGEFKTDDTVVYIEVDSILPDGLDDDLKASYDILKKELKKATGERISEIEREMSDIISKNTRPEFEFLRQKKFRIKVLKYNFDNGFGEKIYSMGIVFSTSILPIGSCEIVEGTDVTQILGITKVVEDLEELNSTTDVDERSLIETFLDNKFNRYKFYRKMKKKIKGEKISGKWLDIFPPRSDEENAQKVYSKIVENHGREGYYKSEKCEGQNETFYLLQSSSFFGFGKKWNFGVCSRTRNLITDDGSDFWKTAKELDAEKKLRKVGKNIFVRGERCAPKLQNNIYGFKGNKFFVFDVYDLDEQRLYTFGEMIKFCNDYGFEHVPILDDNYIIPETVQEILNESNGYSVFGEKVLREGIVIRKKDNPKVSFKARSPEYLLKWGK